MPLLLLKVGEISKIIKISGNDQIIKRINAMGLNVGDEVKVISYFNGNIIILVKNSKLALSKEVASRIHVG